MRRSEAMKRLDKKSRNKLRAILSNGDADAINSLGQLRVKLGKGQLDALEVILNSSALLRAYSEIQRSDMHCQVKIPV